MKRKINILIVGTASRAQSLIRTIVQMPDVNILAICDLLPYYDIPTKQTFIALEDINALSDKAQKFAEEKSVINLNSAFTLYDIIWKEASKK